MGEPANIGLPYICVFKMLGRGPEINFGVQIWPCTPYFCIVMYLKIAYRKDTKNYRVEIVRSVRDAKGRPNKEVIKRLGLAPLVEHLERFYPVLDLKLQTKTVPVNQSSITYPT